MMVNGILAIFSAGQEAKEASRRKKMKENLIILLKTSSTWKKVRV